MYNNNVEDRYSIFEKCRNTVKYLLHKKKVFTYSLIRQEHLIFYVTLEYKSLEAPAQ